MNSYTNLGHQVSYKKIEKTKAKKSLTIKHYNRANESYKLINELN